MSVIGEAASIITVVELSAKVIGQCIEYSTKVKDAREDINRLRDEVTLLHDVLTRIHDLLDSENSADLAIFNHLNRKEGPLTQSKNRLEQILLRLDGKRSMKPLSLRALKWPFTSKEIEKIVSGIRDERGTFNLALTSDQIIISRTIKRQQSDFLREERNRKIRDWLSAPDPSSNYNAAREKQQPTTGDWFINGSQFAQWKIDDCSFLWLYGIPGCGKTVLSSTILHHVLQLSQQAQDIEVGYFFFDFSDGKKKQSEGLIRSLISQGFAKIPDIPERLNSTSKDNSQKPTARSLLPTLRDIVDRCSSYFLILDALDECADREELLKTIKVIIDWKLKNLHVLATSRKEIDIQESLETCLTSQISIQDEIVSADIYTFVRARLQSDHKLKRWPEKVKAEIEETLKDGAHGMFRWVACQLDEIRKCLKIDVLRKTLKSLPRDLDSTYARILENISEHHKQDALTILQWVAFSARPMSLKEVAEATAINLECSPPFDKERRLLNPQAVLEICSSLVTLSSSPSRISEITFLKEEVDKDSEIEVNDDLAIDEEDYELRLAHYSVKEYLVSNRVQKFFSIEENSHASIARACLAYLQDSHVQEACSSRDFEQFPLAKYAAEFWWEHARGPSVESDISDNIVAFFGNVQAFRASLGLFNPLSQTMEPQIVYASSYGLYKVVQLLLDSGASVKARGRYSNALYAASVHGHIDVVQLLLEKGADVNAQGGYYGNALHAASSQGCIGVVQLLLDKGANVNGQGGYYGNVLQAASYHRYIDIVHLLLDKGADVNVQGGNYGNLLQAASYYGYIDIVQLLLNKGANVNAQGGRYGNALRAASEEGHIDVVQLLLDNGADVDDHMKTRLKWLENRDNRESDGSLEDDSSSSAEDNSSVESI
ncbi:MAG: hypothetical protein Q9167_007497 [Letrouitia subvulpina]